MLLDEREGDPHGYRRDGMPSLEESISMPPITTVYTLSDVSRALGVSERWVRDQVSLGAPHLRGRPELGFSPAHYEHLLRLASAADPTPRVRRWPWRARRSSSVGATSQTRDEQEPGQVDDVDAAGRGETEPRLVRPGDVTDPGSVGGASGGA